MSNSLKLILINILRSFLGLVRSKVLAYFWGPAQIGALGQLFTFYNIETKLINFGTGAALNSLYSKYSQDEQKSLLTTVLIVSSISTAVVTILTVITAGTVSQLLLNDSSFVNYFYLFAIIGILYSVSILMETTFQADRNFKTLIRGQGFSIITAIIFVIPLTYLYGLAGILYDLIVWFSASIIFFIIPYSKQYLPKIKFRNLDKKTYVEIIKLSSSDLIRSILFFGSYFILRIVIIKFLPLAEIGLFQSAFSITSYINVIIQGFIIYFFPTISSQINADSIKSQFQNALSFVLKIEFVLITVFFVFPQEILAILYSGDFSKSDTLLIYLSFGKLFESFYLVGIIVLLGQQKLRSFLFIELIRSLSIILIPYFMISHWGISGFVWGINLTYIATSVALLLILTNNNFIGFNKQFVFSFSKFIIAAILFIIIHTIEPFSVFLRIGYFVLIFAWINKFSIHEIKNYLKLKSFLHKDID